MRHGHQPKPGNGPLPMPPRGGSSGNPQLHVSPEQLAAIQLQNLEKIRMSCIECAVNTLTTHPSEDMTSLDQRKSFVVEAAKAFYEFVKGHEEKAS